MLFFVRLWYRLTMAWTRWTRRTAPVIRVDRPGEVASRIYYGDSYRADPRWFDYLAHPGVFQARIDARQSTFDCEDHAAYWACVLLKSRVVAKVGIGFVYWLDHEGAREAHAICIFETYDGERFWADYRAPRRLSTSAPWWAYGDVVRQLYSGRELRKVAFLEVTGVREDDTLIFRGEHLVKRRGFGF